jgi:hypothetical protein
MLLLHSLKVCHLNQIILGLYMEQSHSSEANSRSSSQGISRLLWDTKVHYRDYNSQSLAPIRRQMNPVHTLPSYSLTM